MTKNDEQVLAIPTQRLRDAGVFQGLCRDIERYAAALLDPAHFTFLPRSQAENDPNFKQLIPYVVMKYREQVFCYTRGQGAGEKRLRALRSIGIGGHINPIDHGATDHPYRVGMLREVAEEVILATEYHETCVGFINDDSTPVGQVHLGIVHLFELVAPNIQRREVELTQAGLLPLAELLREIETFETWSQFVLKELSLGGITSPQR